MKIRDITRNGCGQTAVEEAYIQFNLSIGNIRMLNNDDDELIKRVHRLSKFFPKYLDRRTN